MSKLSVFVAAGLGAALAALHITSTKSAADQIKAAAQKELDAQKPQVISLVKQYASQAKTAAQGQTDAPHVAALQVNLFASIDGAKLPDLAKTALKMAVVQGVTQANADTASSAGVGLLDKAEQYIVAKIQAARL